MSSVLVCCQTAPHEDGSIQHPESASIHVWLLAVPLLCFLRGGDSPLSPVTPCASPVVGAALARR